MSGFALVSRERCFTTVLPHGYEWIGRSVHVAAQPLGNHSRHVDMETVLVRDLGCD